MERWGCCPQAHSGEIGAGQLGRPSAHTTVACEGCSSPGVAHGLYKVRGLWSNLFLKLTDTGDSTIPRVACSSALPPKWLESFFPTIQPKSSLLQTKSVFSLVALENN